jgi:hypothetical protein
VEAAVQGEVRVETGKIKIEIIGVASIQDIKTTQFMQCCDMFEKFKVAAELINLHYVLEYTGEAEKDLSTYIQHGIDLAKVEFEKSLVFAHVQEVRQGEHTIRNISTVPYVDPEISVVSNGEKWGLVVDMIKSFCPGIKIEEGEIRKIKSLTWPQQEKTSIAG